MKKLLNYKSLTTLLLLTLLFSCNDDDNDYTSPTTQNIVETAQSTPALSSLVSAILAADGDLASVLSGGNYTVLAPTNTAFSTFLSENGFSSLEDVPTDVLSNILLNHVINGTVMSSDLNVIGTGYTSTNATNPTGDVLSLYFNTNSGVTFNGVSDVVSADISASNGVVHVVDAVIALPSVVTFATADPTFETLVAALTREDLSSPDSTEADYVSVLSLQESPAPFTVFAPTNDAFGSLLSELGLSSLGDINTETLRATLNTHVVASANVKSTDLTDNMPVGTLGDPLTITLNPAQLTDQNGRVANIVAVDVQAYNGIIHVIDNVVLPML